MNKIFGLDSPLIQILNKVADLMILNLLWLVLCIPIITIGPATTAMYYVTLKLAKNEESYIFRSFFQSFRQNFKQATLIWLGMLVAGAIILVDVRFFNMQGGTFNFIVSVFFKVLLVLYCVLLIYVFPTLSRFDNTSRKIMKNAMFLAIKHLPSTIIICAIVVVGGIITIKYPIAIFLVFSGVAYASSIFFVKIFDKYSKIENPIAVEDTIENIE